jgi:beta-lactamase regulating signal transducer with metallopeptidase domain/HEAT repeat protein
MNLASLLATGGQSLNVPLVLLLIKATTILLAALGITLAMQRASAGSRHLVWLVTLGALLLIPALTAWGPLRLEILPAPEPAAAPSVAAVPAVPTVPAVPQTVITNGPATVVAIATQGGATPASAASAASASSASTGLLASIRDASLWVVALALWAAVALAIVASLTWSTLVVRRLVRRSEPLDDQSWLTPLYEVSDRLGLDEPPRLLMSRDAKMPFACGLATPTIVLPAECESWSHERRLAVLLHELAHVRRRDLLGHTLGRLVCAVYWFHPLAWTAARQLRAESERACDDLALACGTRATDYAEHLLDIVTSVRREATPMVALAMARRKEFEGRMLAILDPELRHSTPSRMQSATLIGTLALLSIVVGAVVPAPASAKPAASRNAASHEARQESAIAIRTPEAMNDANVANDRAPEEPLAGQRERTRTTTQTHTTQEATSQQVRQATQAQQRSSASSVDEPAESAFAKVVTSAVGVVMERVVPKAIESGANAATVKLQELIKQAPQSKQAADERATLLAKVLRSDSSASLRRTAAWGLSEYADDQAAVDALINAVRHDANESVREMAAWSLSESERSSGAVDALAAALHDASVAVRKTAAWSLGNVGDQRAVEPLVAALADANADVRARAVWGLGNVTPKEAPRQLVAMLRDSDPKVRELTAWALFEIEDPSTAPALQAALRTEQDKDIQLGYIRALAAMGDKSVDAIRPLLESSDQRIKTMAVRSLAGGHATGPWPHPWPQPRPYP